MPMLLEQWQDRLARHFESLAHTRADSGLQIFALEHGLNEAEIEDISSLLRSRIEARLPLSPHWLVWVIHATERGYAYTGDEYWPSFEEETPRWKFEDRYKFVRWFKKFQRTYDGVVPSGRWADHFSIISWPITHAILPQDLQKQMAKALYDLRYRLVGLKTLDLADIGRLLAANTHHSSRRFQVFLQQEELTGQVVLALLGTAPTGDNEPIYQPTLKRIVRDLERARNAREWLQETRHFVRDRFEGIGSGQPEQGTPIQDLGVTTRGPTQFSIRPNLLLGHRGGGTWSVRLEIPSFRNVAVLNADIQSFLKRTRCRLNGADDFKPAGWLLSGNRKGVLKAWPDIQKPLVQFEQSNEIVDNLLESECRLTSGPVWLFRLASDGTAREIVGHIVRPGCSYIVVTTEELPEPHSGMSPCRIDCTGINAFRLQIAFDVSAEDTGWLKGLGLQVARTIRVWPAGLPGRGWDGEGSSEWLTTEAPCFGITHDHPIDAYSLCLNNGTPAVIEAGRMGNPVFVRIAPLPAGTHTLRVNAQRSASLDALLSTPQAEGFVHLHVREPEPWTPGVVSHTGLIATIEPHDADLDIFWRNEVAVSVLGPESHSVELAISLTSRNGRQILSEQVGRSMKLPVMPDAWRNRFSQFLRHDKNTQSYLEAASGQLEIRGEELGEISFRFEHDIVPLRWILRRDHDNIVVRLIDDTGREASGLEVLFFSMERPLKEERRSSEKALSEIVVQPAGGLFYAKQGDHRDLVIVSAVSPSKGFKSLGINTDFADLRRYAVGVAKSLRLYAYWHEARLFGPLVGIRRQQITDDLLNLVYETLCGSNWAGAETAFRKEPNSQQALETLERTVEKRSTGFAAGLRREHVAVEEDLNRRSQWYSDLAVRFLVSADRKLSDFALRLACEAHHVPSVFDSELDGMLDAVRSNPALLRGARLLALLSANQKHNQPEQLPRRSQL